MQISNDSNNSSMETITQQETFTLNLHELEQDVCKCQSVPLSVKQMHFTSVNLSCYCLV